MAHRLDMGSVCGIITRLHRWPRRALQCSVWRSIAGAIFPPTVQTMRAEKQKQAVLIRTRLKEELFVNTRRPSNGITWVCVVNALHDPTWETKLKDSAC